MLSAFGMADDDGGGARIPEHLRADIAHERAGDVPMAVLSSDGDAAGRCLCGAREQRRRWADQHVGLRRRRVHKGGNALDLAQLLRQAVHLPVASD
jgi:hypothetical protein